jgi:beta-lactamase regulating signal transducer with metallopeptidase domain
LLGAGLPALFRIRHPKTQLAFYQSVLVTCLLLPLVEPWEHPLLIASAGSIPASPTAHTGYSWMTLAGWIVAAGIVARLCSLIAGYWQTRCYRAASTPIAPLPESIRSARSLTHSDARFGISSSVDGPATLGHIDPIVLLPEAFVSLDYDAQLSIACHELLHVKRKDWIVTMFEEVVAAIFWFNPAMWLLRSQIRLSREQLVDAEVVLLTEAPAPYVQALLAMAGAAKGPNPIPAASFLADGHLASRIRSLLSDSRRSTARLCFSYVSAAGLLFALGWCATLWFPLTGQAQSIEAFALQHRTPPRLIARKKALESRKVNPPEFTMRVPVPVVPSKDVMYFVNPGLPEALPENTFGPTRIFLSRGLRVLRLGDIPTPEEIARLQPGPDDGAIVDVIRSPEGIIQRITIHRRSFSNETDPGPSSADLSTNTAIRIH